MSMSQRDRRRRRIAGWSVLLVFVLVLVIFGPIAWATWRNDRAMEVWLEEISETSEIEGAQLIESGSRFGLQPGTNGNHCDREAWHIYRTSLGLEAIEEHFLSQFATSSADIQRTTATATLTKDDVVCVDFWYRFDPGTDPRCW